MKKKLWSGLAVGVMMLATSEAAHAQTFTFSDQDFLGGASWGSMTIDQVNAQTLSVRYDASSSSIIPAGSQATGFAFGVNYPAGTSLSSISNPTDGVFDWDNNDRDWILYAKAMGTLPTPANANEFTGEYFTFAATEGNANNFTVPGLGPDQSDIFYLHFSAPFNLSLTEWTGVRLQSLPDTINEGSLFLVGGNNVPEPATMLLFGTGLAGLAGLRLRKKM